MIQQVSENIDNYYVTVRLGGGSGTSQLSRLVEIDEILKAIEEERAGYYTLKYSSSLYFRETKSVIQNHLEVLAKTLVKKGSPLHAKAEATIFLHLDFHAKGFPIHMQGYVRAFNKEAAIPGEGITPERALQRNYKNFLETTEFVLDAVDIISAGNIPEDFQERLSSLESSSLTGEQQQIKNRNIRQDRRCLHTVIGRNSSDLKIYMPTDANGVHFFLESIKSASKGAFKLRFPVGFQDSIYQNLEKAIEKIIARKEQGFPTYPPIHLSLELEFYSGDSPNYLKGSMAISTEETQMQDYGEFAKIAKFVIFAVNNISKGSVSLQLRAILKDICSQVPFPKQDKRQLRPET